MKKEELVAQNARLQQTVQDLTRSDNAIKEKLSIILGRPTAFTRQNDILSWYEICAEIGKLIARADALDLSYQTHSLELKVNDLLQANQQREAR